MIPDIFKQRAIILVVLNKDNTLKYLVISLLKAFKPFIDISLRHKGHTNLYTHIEFMFSGSYIIDEQVYHCPIR